MRRCLTVAMILLGVAAVQEGLLACGDKFFLVGRGDRFGRAYASLHPGRILIYTGGATATSKALADGRLQKYFTRAGHHVTVAADMTTLDRALQSGSVDLVLAELNQALDLMPRVDSVASKPTLLPVADDSRATPPARHQFTATLKASDKINGFLARIEDVMKARFESAPRR